MAEMAVFTWLATSNEGDVPIDNNLVKLSRAAFMTQ